jgi:hypothetical protein
MEVTLVQLRQNQIVKPRLKSSLEKDLAKTTFQHVQPAALSNVSFTFQFVQEHSLVVPEQDRKAIGGHLYQYSKPTQEHQENH